MKYLTFSFFKSNCSQKIVDLQKSVFSHFGDPIDQICDTVSHGEFLDNVMQDSSDAADAIVFFDIDCIPLRPGVIRKAVAAALRKNAVVGCAQQANHIEFERYRRRFKDAGPIVDFAEKCVRHFAIKAGIDFVRYKNPLVYAGPCFMVVPTQLYNAVGKPTLQATERCDVAGELTLACHRHNSKVMLLQPTYCETPRYKLGNVQRFGPGTVYGQRIFHAFETVYRTNSHSAKMFEQWCKLALEAPNGMPRHLTNIQYA